MKPYSHRKQIMIPTKTAGAFERSGCLIFSIKITISVIDWHYSDRKLSPCIDKANTYRYQQNRGKILPLQRLLQKNSGKHNS